MVFDLWDVYQHGQIGNAQATANAARRKAANTGEQSRRELARLESKVDMLALTCQALWEVLRDQTHLSDEDVIAKIKEIDAKDGTVDGKMTGQPIDCPGCGRPGHTRQQVCMYCGDELGAKQIFKS